MIDINLIRKDPEGIKAKLLKKADNIDFTELLEWDKQRSTKLHEIEEYKAKRNKGSGEVAKLKAAGKEDAAKVLITEMAEIGKVIAEKEPEINALEGKIQDFLARLPNIPDDDVPVGDKPENVVLRTWGEKPKFTFTPKDHVTLETNLGLIDYERGVKLGGNGFWIYSGMGARLEWALLNYFIESHLEDGFQFMLLPHILNYECGYGAGQFPKFADDVFQLKNGDLEGQFLLPTAETALVNLHRDEILDEKDLPKKYFGYTPCYRREAGSYRAEERGCIRGHQFNKVEMVEYVLPENSESALAELVEKAEKLVRGLGLHHQVSMLATKDCSYSMAKTFDIEVWIPSMNIYKEVSSASNAKDYQSRRSNMKVRKSTGEKDYMHTLNASGLATSRLLPAILEQHQNEDGSVNVPEVLQKWIGTDLLK